MDVDAVLAHVAGLPGYPNAQQVTHALRLIDELGEVAIETNEGTFSATECRRATGNGDPASGSYTKVMDLVTGEVRVIGRVDPRDAP